MKQAAEHGVATTVCYFEKQFPDVKESIVRTEKHLHLGTPEKVERRTQGHLRRDSELYHFAKETWSILTLSSSVHDGQ